MRFAYILAAAVLLFAACGDDDYGADGPQQIVDLSGVVNADLSPDLTPPVDLAHD